MAYFDLDTPHVLEIWLGYIGNTQIDEFDDTSVLSHYIDHNHHCLSGIEVDLDRRIQIYDGKLH